MPEPDPDPLETLLRGTLGEAPTPSLAASFDARLTRRLHPLPLGARRRRLLEGYAASGLALCLGAMWGSGLPVWVAAPALVAPLAFGGAVLLRFRTRGRMRPSSP